jgi:creatinine amidohydrolase
VNAETVAEEGANRYDGEVVVAPTIPVGVAEEHRHFTGTLWVSEDNFRAYVRDVVSSLAAHGWTRIVLVNGHGGNVPALREVGAKITRHDDAYAVPFTWFDAISDHGDNMGHGGPIETSLLRHTYPELVREGELESAAEDASDGWGEWEGSVNLAYDSAEFTENGVVGDPSKSDAALGERLLELSSDALVDLLQRLAERDLSGPVSR